MIGKPPQTYTGHHMLMVMLAFFATVFTANMTMVYFATQSWTGLVVRNAYVASQEFNATTERRERAAASIRTSVIYTHGNLSISLKDNRGMAVDAIDVKLKIGRPSHEEEDRVVELEARGGGTYAVALQLAKGQWSGDVTANIPGHPDWQRPVRLLVSD